MGTSSARRPHAEGIPQTRDYSRNRTYPGHRPPAGSSLPDTAAGHTPAKQVVRSARPSGQARLTRKLGTESPSKKKKRNPAKKNQTYARIKSSSKNMPGVFKRGNVFFVVERGQQYRPSKNLLISLAVIFCCALMVVLAHAQITGVETQILQANRQLRSISDENFALETQMRRHYTTDQIEYIAFMRLGMTHPDPAQIIEINVPRQNHVMFNTAEEILPQENYFWPGLRMFFSGILDRLIGG